MIAEPRGRMAAVASESEHQLTSDLDEWRVTLTTGDVVVLRAHGVKEADGYFVFVALMKGLPHYEYEVAKVPAAVVADVSGG
jgi:hypothetical protein